MCSSWRLRLVSWLQLLGSFSLQCTVKAWSSGCAREAEQQLGSPLSLTLGQRCSYHHHMPLYILCQ